MSHLEKKIRLYLIKPEDTNNYQFIKNKMTRDANLYYRNVISKIYTVKKTIQVK